MPYCTRKDAKVIRTLCLIPILLLQPPVSELKRVAAGDVDVKQLASQVTIHRDEWGVAHILGETDEATLFGSGYAQAEDNLWQIEDNVARGIGRYAELYGEVGLRNDLLNRAFEIPQRSKQDFAMAVNSQRRLIEAFVAGINAYLASHPNAKTRMLERFEPWHVLAMDRHFILDFAYGRVHAGRPEAKLFEVHNVPAQDQAAANEVPSAAWHHLAAVPATKLQRQSLAAIGSNEWSLAPKRTKSGAAMLFINPHQPWYGWGQFFEFHIHSRETLRFSGAGFLGSPIPSIGHNDQLGWTYTVNDPDIADAWLVDFEAADSLDYRHGSATRTAEEWTDTINVKQGEQLKRHQFRFRKTHHGPVVGQRGPSTYVVAKIAKLYSLDRGEQAFGMIRASNFEEWKTALSACAIPLFNVAYADRDGNIFYAYNGAIPVRNEEFNWRAPVDGNDPRTDWQGIHAFDDLPQVLNPPTGYVQNCNSSPFTTTDDWNPSRGDFPSYMVEDADEDKRRAKLSRMLLRRASNVDFETFQQLAFDTTLYWPMTELPRFQRQLSQLTSKDSDFAEKVRPLLNHLSDWDFRATVDSTQTALCLAWYEALYGLGYPGETMKPRYRGNPNKQFEALIEASEKLKRLHGTWKVRWGDVHRLQRVYQKATVTEAALSFNRFGKSFEMAGAPGPLGVVFTVYSTPSVPLVRPARYGVVGACYVATIEFGERIRTASINPFGCRADPTSPHAIDQSPLFAGGKLKTAWYYPDEVLENAQSSYHPSIAP